MAFIPRQVKLPPRIALTCKVPEGVAALLKHYAEFLDSTQEHVVIETLRLAFRRDKEFQTWLAATHPETRVADRDPQARPLAQPQSTSARRARPDAQGERERS